MQVEDDERHSMVVKSVAMTSRCPLWWTLRSLSFGEMTNEGSTEAASVQQLLLALWSRSTGWPADKLGMAGSLASSKSRYLGGDSSSPALEATAEEIDAEG